MLKHEWKVLEGIPTAFTQGFRCGAEFKKHKLLVFNLPHKFRNVRNIVLRIFVISCLSVNLGTTNISKYWFCVHFNKE